MLNTDYKILAKAMSTRMKSVLPSIIGPQQTGFMEGRSIHSNIRRMIDIISHVNQAKKSVVIVSIDFEKCFDRIEHESIFAAMRYFNFGELFIEWTKIFFTDFLICTQNGGFNSDF